MRHRPTLASVFAVASLLAVGCARSNEEASSGNDSLTEGGSMDLCAAPRLSTDGASMVLAHCPQGSEGSVEVVTVATGARHRVATYPLGARVLAHGATGDTVWYVTVQDGTPARVFVANARTDEPPRSATLGNVNEPDFATDFWSHPQFAIHGSRILLLDGTDLNGRRKVLLADVAHPEVPAWSFPLEGGAGRSAANLVVGPGGGARVLIEEDGATLALADLDAATPTVVPLQMSVGGASIPMFSTMDVFSQAFDGKSAIVSWVGGDGWKVMRLDTTTGALTTVEEQYGFQGTASNGVQDGTLFYGQVREGEFVFSSVGIAGGEPRVFAKAPGTADRPPRLAFTSDHKSALIVPHGGGATLVSVDGATPPRTLFPGAAASLTILASGGDRHVVAMRTATGSVQAYLIDGHTGDVLRTFEPNTYPSLSGDGTRVWTSEKCTLDGGGDGARLVSLDDPHSTSSCFSANGRLNTIPGSASIMLTLEQPAAAGSPAHWGALLVRP